MNFALCTLHFALCTMHYELCTVLVCLEPVLAPSAVGQEGDGKGSGGLHLLDDELLEAFFLLRRHREVEFVVYLQHHLRAQSFGLHALVDAYHGHLDDVGCVDKGFKFSIV